MEGRKRRTQTSPDGGAAQPQASTFDELWGEDLDADPSGELLGELGPEKVGTAVPDVNEEARGVAEVPLDHRYPLLASGENGLDGPEILVVEHESQRDLPSHTDTTRGLEGEAGGVGIGLDEAAGPEFRAPEPAGHDDDSVADPGSFQVVEDRSSGAS